MRKGTHHSEETRIKMSDNHYSKKGMSPWNKGLIKEIDNRVANCNKGKPLSEEHKQKLRENHWSKTGVIEHPFKGKFHSEYTKNLIRKAHLGKSLSDSHRYNIRVALKGRHTSVRTEFKKGHNFGFKKGHMPWNTGKPRSEETKEKLRQYTRERASNWKGGISFEPYSPEFNKKLKEKIRQRDQYRCQECFRHQNELNKNKLAIHHIDFNKKNNNESNLISLCPNCHAQTNFDRENWTNYFENEMCKRGLK